MQERRSDNTRSIRYKGHLYKGQLVKIMTFTKQFIRDASLEASSLNLMVSLIKDTECIVTSKTTPESRQNSHNIRFLQE